MKNKYIISLFLLGAIGWILASLMKIMHAPLSNEFFKISSAVMIISILIFAIKMILSKDAKSFLNK